MRRSTGSKLILIATAAALLTTVGCDNDRDREVTVIRQHDHDRHDHDRHDYDRRDRDRDYREHDRDHRDRDDDRRRYEHRDHD